MPPSYVGHLAGTPEQQTSYLAHAVEVIEERLLHLTKEVAQGPIPLEDFISEVSLLVKDLRRCFRRILEMKERRDLGFRALQELQLAESHCIWLYRKTHVEEAFFKKLHLETKLRRMISAEAFNVYQELLDAEDQERDFLRKGNADISGQLLGDQSSCEDI